jgi:putative endopeptidase
MQPGGLSDRKSVMRLSDLRPSALLALIRPDRMPRMPPAFEPKNLDRKVSPGTDFFQYANGHWLKTHPIRSDRSSVSAFGEVDDRNSKILLGALHQLAKNPPSADSAMGKLAAFYASAMNDDAIQKAGTQPIAPLMKKISDMRSSADLAGVMAELQKVGVDVPLGIEGAPDFADSQNVIPVLWQGGLGLPEKEYYTKTDADSEKLKTQYQAHIAKMFELLGSSSDQARAQAAAVFGLEDRLANVSMGQLEMRDPAVTQNVRSLQELEAQAPQVPWKSFFGTLGAKGLERIQVGQPEFVQKLGEMFNQVPLEDWKTYLQWQLVSTYAPYLDKKFGEESFAFYGKTLNGTKARSPKEKRVLSDLSSSMGDGIGKLFIERAFSPEAKQRTDEMVENIRDAFAEHIRNNPWMEEATKAKALEKLAAIKSKIGYPEKFDDYAQLQVDAKAPWAENVIRANRYAFDKGMSDIGKPPDPNAFDMVASEVNAYYSPNTNEVVFPAGILQSPFFDIDADDAVNYGATGATIGHELTHAFDDEGRQFDGAGNFSNWWTDHDAEEYKKRTQPLIDQFSAQKVGNVPVNGELSLGENIADLGGLAIAYDAYKRALKGKEPKTIDGFTGDQRFFLAYATSWRSKKRQKALEVQVRSDPHAPEDMRSNLPLTNLPEFAKAFHLDANAPMNKKDEDRIVIW